MKGWEIVRGSYGAPPPGHLWGWTAPKAPAQSACGSSCLVSRAEATKTSGTLVARHSKKRQDSDPLIQLRGEGPHLARASSFLLASSWALSPQERAGGRQHSGVSARSSPWVDTEDPLSPLPSPLPCCSTPPSLPVGRSPGLLYI